MNQVHPSLRHISYAGVPRADRQMVAELATRPKSGPSPMHVPTGTMRTLENVLDDLGFSRAERQEWKVFLAPLLDDPYSSAIQVRADIHWKMQEGGLDSALRRALMAKALNYWRTKHALKSLDAAVRDTIATHATGAAPGDIKHLADSYGHQPLLKSLRSQATLGRIEYRGGRFHTQDQAQLYLGSDAQRYHANIDTLCKAGEFADAMELVKAAHHKYLRRIPTGKSRPKYRYIYSANSRSHDAEVAVGEKVKIPHGEKAGHYEVKAVHGKWATLKHDETGHEVTVRSDQLHEMFLEEHGEAHDDARKKLEHINKKARKHGSDAQQQQAQAKLDAHRERFPGKAAFEAKKAAHAASKGIAETSLDYEAHRQAALKHKKAVEVGSPDAQGHAKAIKSHVKLARILKAKAVREGTTETKLRPGRMGPKPQAWAEIEANMPQVQSHSREAYRDSSGHGYQEFDSINEHLDLKKPDKWSRRKDPRVKTMAEAFTKLTRGIREWHDGRLDEVMELIRTVPGYERAQLPDHATDYRTDQETKAREADHYKEQQERHVQIVERTAPPVSEWADMAEAPF